MELARNRHKISKMSQFHIYILYIKTYLIIYLTAIFKGPTIQTVIPIDISSDNAGLLTNFYNRSILLCWQIHDRVKY